MALERVEEGVSPTEVLAAVQMLADRETMCFQWPGVWLDAHDRRNFYYVRYDLMTRDWGGEVAENSRQRLQEFVDMGFLTMRARPDIGADIVEYALTAEGALYLQGSPYGGGRPSFCAPAQRRIVEITSMESGAFACGSLRVQFTHTADGWPSWARTDPVRTRVAQTWGPVNASAPGSVTLSRQWFSREAMPEDMRENGELRSVCLDPTTRAAIGDDMEFAPTSP